MREICGTSAAIYVYRRLTFGSDAKLCHATFTSNEGLVLHKHTGGAPCVEPVSYAGRSVNGSSCRRGGAAMPVALLFSSVSINGRLLPDVYAQYERSPLFASYVTIRNASSSHKA